MHAAALHRVHFGLLPISCYFGSMGQQNRSPEVIDAEFEIVRPADQTVEERVRATPWWRRVVVIPMITAWVWGVLLVGFTVLAIVGLQVGNARYRDLQARYEALRASPAQAPPAPAP